MTDHELIDTDISSTVRSRQHSYEVDVSSCHDNKWHVTPLRARVALHRKPFEEKNSTLSSAGRDYASERKVNDKAPIQEDLGPPHTAHT